MTLRMLPVIMAAFYLLGNAGLGVGLQVLFHYIGLVFAPLLFMYLASHVFKFCAYHRLFIYYVIIVELLNVVDWYFTIPYDNQIITIIHDIVTVLLFIGIAIQLIVKKKLI
jgi:hypothetical protein